MVDKVGEVYPKGTEDITDKIFSQLEGETLAEGIDKYMTLQKRQAEQKNPAENNDKITVVFVDRLMPYDTARDVLAKAGLELPANKEDAKGLSGFDEYHLDDDVDISKMMPRHVHLLFCNGRFEDCGRGSTLLHLIEGNNPNHRFLLLHQIHDAQRVTDVSFYTGSGDRMFFRCKMDGEQRPGQQVPNNMIKEPYRYHLLDYLQEELEQKWRNILGNLPELNHGQTEEQSKGFKR